MGAGKNFKVIFTAHNMYVANIDAEENCNEALAPVLVKGKVQTFTICIRLSNPIFAGL